MLRLEPQPAKVLTVLIRNAGEVVTRQDLIREVWGTETFVDFEQGLNYAIRRIRIALEDDAEHSFWRRYPGRGTVSPRKSTATKKLMGTLSLRYPSRKLIQTEE